MVMRMHMRMHTFSMHLIRKNRKSIYNSAGVECSHLTFKN